MGFNYWIIVFTGISMVFAIISVLISRRTNFSLWYIYPVEKRNYNRITMLIIDITTLMGTIVLIKNLYVFPSLPNVAFWSLASLIFIIVLFFSFVFGLTKLDKRTSILNDDTVEDYMARTLTLFNGLTILSMLIVLINIGQNIKDLDLQANDNQLINAFKPFLCLTFITSIIACYLSRILNETKIAPSGSSSGGHLLVTINYREKMDLCRKINRR